MSLQYLVEMNAMDTKGATFLMLHMTFLQKADRFGVEGLFVLKKTQNCFAKICEQIFTKGKGGNRCNL